MSTSRSTGRRAITASPCSRACRSNFNEQVVLRQDRLPPRLGRARRARRPARSRSLCIISMCRPAATCPIPRSIRNSRTSSPFSTRCASRRELRCRRRARDPGRRSQRRAARARRLEPQAAAAGRVAHADRMREARRRAEGRQLGRRHAHFVPEPAKLYTWWSYRAPDWAAANKGRRLDHIWVAPALADRRHRIEVTRASRGWERPSDHVPVTATLEVCSRNDGVMRVEHRHRSHASICASTVGCASPDVAQPARGVGKALQHLEEQLRGMRITVDGSGGRGGRRAVSVSSATRPSSVSGRPSTPLRLGCLATGRNEPSWTT